jgi:hypothetical protein
MLILRSVENEWMSDPGDDTASGHSVDEDALARQRHESFAEALDRLPADAEESEWITLLAADLGWDRGEVELYAYQYFLALLEQSPAGSEQGPLDDNQRNGTNSESSRPWTAGESILFDTLVARYRPSNTDHGGIGQGDWAQQVAERLPGRTAGEVRERWQQIMNRSSTGD